MINVPLRFWQLIAVFLFFVLPAQAETDNGIFILYQRTESCQHATLLLYSHSSHPGGNARRYLNESNRGIGFRCQFSETSPYYFSASGLKNSQFGNTFAGGFGGRWHLIDFHSIKLSLGGELPWIFYEHPRAGKAMWGFLPIVTVGLTYDLPRRWGTIGYVQNHLADTGVRLVAIQYTRSY